MEVVKSISEVRELITREQEVGNEIGLVPTMGCFHEGHLALMEAAKQNNDTVVVSIFVNPTQFEPDEDYEDYPRDLDRDLKMAEEVGVDIVFAPPVDEIYLPQAVTKVVVEELTDQLCGACRPNHFTGVTTIVAKLFNIIDPDRAYFGQKDAQQVVVVRRMVKDLNFDLEIETIPIQREEDGLAVSSRNQYLDQQEREAATVLFESLQLGRKLINDGERSAEVVRDSIINQIQSEPLAEIDYVEVVDHNTLEPCTKLEGEILIALAVYVGQARLIDNLMLEVTD
ncbi:MAG: pantoate--beta-alanine ligase [Bacillota bacterium]